MGLKNKLFELMFYSTIIEMGWPLAKPAEILRKERKTEKLFLECLLVKCDVAHLFPPFEEKI